MGVAGFLGPYTTSPTSGMSDMLHGDSDLMGAPRHDLRCSMKAYCGKCSSTLYFVQAFRPLPGVHCHFFPVTRVPADGNLDLTAGFRIIAMNHRHIKPFPPRRWARPPSAPGAPGHAGDDQ